MTNDDKAETIRSAVRDRYAEIAVQGGQHASAAAGEAECDCCSSYPVEMLDELPNSVTELSLGCGDAVSGAAIQAGETVLDLGSGGGIDCFLAARAVGPDGMVIGVDMTPEMLDRARANAERMGVDNVEFRSGHIERLPVEDASVDVVISNCVINLAPDKAPVFAEIARVLVPGGRIHVSDIVTKGPMAPEVARGLDSWSECIAGALPADVFADGLRAAGLEDVTVTPAELTAKWTATGPGMPFSAMIQGRKPQA